MSKHAMKNNLVENFRTRKNISEDGGLAIEIDQKTKIKVFYFSLTLIMI
jgi:hypothetical protein